MVMVDLEVGMDLRKEVRVFLRKEEEEGGGGGDRWILEEK